MSELKRQLHTIPPVYDSDSRILILGSFPSVKSREYGFFYGHPQNRFWRVLAFVCGCEIPESIEDKKQLLISNHIALWDVIGECDIIGSSDSSITGAVPNDIGMILGSCDIRAVFTNGKTADKLYRKHLLPVHGRDALCLPSTSPANASWSFERLCGEWRIICDKIS